MFFEIKLLTLKKTLANATLVEQKNRFGETTSYTLTAQQFALLVYIAHSDQGWRSRKDLAQTIFSNTYSTKKNQDDFRDNLSTQKGYIRKILNFPKSQNLLSYANYQGNQSKGVVRVVKFHKNIDVHTDVQELKSVCNKFNREEINALLESPFLNFLNKEKWRKTKLFNEFVAQEKNLINNMVWNVYLHHAYSEPTKAKELLQEAFDKTGSLPPLNFPQQEESAYDRLRHLLFKYVYIDSNGFLLGDDLIGIIVEKLGEDWGHGLSKEIVENHLQKRQSNDGKTIAAAKQITRSNLFKEKPSKPLEQKGVTYNLNDEVEETLLQEDELNLPVLNDEVETPKETGKITDDTNLFQNLKLGCVRVFLFLLRKWYFLVISLMLLVGMFWGSRILESHGVKALENQKTELAIQSFNFALLLNKKDIILNNLAIAYNQKGIEAKNVGAFDLAKESFEEALAINPNLITANENLAELYNEYGIKAKEDGDRDAEKYFEQALAINPDLDVAVENLAELYSEYGIEAKESGDNDAAEEYFKQALEQNPNLIVANEGLAKIYIECGLEEKINGNINAAEECFSLALDFNPNDASTYYNLAVVYEEKTHSGDDRYDKAIEAYRKALDLDDKHYPAYNNLARLYILTEKVDIKGDDWLMLNKALEYTKNQPSLAVDRATMLKNRGWAYFENEDFSSAEEDLNSAIKLFSEANRKRAAPHCLLAQVYERQEKDIVSVCSEWCACNNGCSRSNYINEVIESDWQMTAQRHFKGKCRAKETRLYCEIQPDVQACRAIDEGLLHLEQGNLQLAEANFSSAIKFYDELGEKRATPFCLRAQVYEAQQKDTSMICKEWRSCTVNYNSSNEVLEPEWQTTAEQQLNECFSNSNQ